MPLEIDSPSPVPFPTSLVVENGVMIFFKLPYYIGVKFFRSNA